MTYIACVYIADIGFLIHYCHIICVHRKSNICLMSAVHHMTGSYIEDISVHCHSR